MRACLALLPSRLRLGWLMMVPVSVATAVIELAAAVAVLWFVARSIDATAETRLPIVADLAPASLAGGAILLAALFLIKNLWVVGSHLLQTWLLERSLRSAFRAYTGAWVAAPFASSGRRGAPDLLHDATEGLTGAFRETLSAAVSALAELLVIVALVALLAWRSPPVVLASAAVLALVLLAALAATRRNALRWGEVNAEWGRRTVRELQQLASGLREIKAFGGERRFLDRAVDTHRRYTRAISGFSILASLPRPLIESAFVCMAATLAILAGGMSSPEQAVPLFALFAYSGFRLIPSANRIILSLDLMRHRAAGVERLSSHLRGLGPGAPLMVAASGRPLRECIAFRDVAHEYRGGNGAALQGLTWRIARGEAWGIVGATGAGKSTLLELLSGLLEPTSGAILIDGEPLESWRRSGGRIGYVPQASWLQDATIAENVAFGVPVGEMDRDRVEWALATACLSDVVSRLEGGLDAAIGEDGSRLSGGERQRLAIARAVYHAPDLLLLDEATAALDADTEAALLENLRALGGTLLLAAHRLEALRRFDGVLLLDAGRVVAKGSWSQLFDHQLSFRRLVATQHATTIARQPRRRSDAAGA